MNNPLHGGSSAEYGQVPSSDSSPESSSVELTNRKSRNFLNNGVKTVKEEEATFREKVKTIDYSGMYAVTLLFIVGCFSGVFINVVLWAAAQLSHSQMKLLLSNDAGPFCLMLTSAALSALAAFVCRKSGRVATIGSGIPEVKALLTNEFHPSELAMIVSSRIGFTRMFGMILSLGAGLSIGSAAPLVHMTVCNAYTIMKLSPDFGSLLENSNMMRQIFNASAAAGMAACFDCPLGGVLFSIEVTSSYYLIANYWRSFMAATAGAVLFTMILWWRGIDEARPFPLTYVENPYNHWEYIMFLMLGLVCGFLAYLYLHLQQRWFLFIRKYSLAQPELVAACVGGFTALMIFGIGSYTSKGITASNLLSDALKTGFANEMTKEGVEPIGGLFAALIIRVMLTVLATTLRIPAGFFTPMILIGAIIGRIFGHIVQNCVPDSTIYISGYAMVGAAAFASGTTHTISAAVVLLESTGQFSMFLPCLIGAIVGSGVVKGHTVNLYNQGLINKGLESFEQLLLESGDFDSAKDMMDSKVVYVQRTCQIGDLLTLMEHQKLSTFPVIDSIESCKLIGCVTRKDVYTFLKRFYASHGLAAFVRQMMPEDTKQDDYSLARKTKMQARTQWLRTQHVLPSEIENERLLNEAAATNPHTNFITSPLAAMQNVANVLSISAHGSTHGGASGSTHPRPEPVRVDEELGAPEEGSDEEDEDASPGDSSQGAFGEFSVDDSSIVERRRAGSIMAGTAPTAPRSNMGPTSIQLEAMLAGTLPPPPSDLPPPPPRPTSAPPALPSMPPPSPPTLPALPSVSSSPSVSRVNSVQQSMKKVLNVDAHVDMAIGRMTDVIASKRKKRIAELSHMTPEQTQHAQELLKVTVDLVAQKALPINPDPFMVHMTSPVDQVYMIFNTVKVNCVFVVEEDLVLQGMISQTNLMQRLKKKK